MYWYDGEGACLKRSFGTRRAARESVATMGKRVRVYRCANCLRWHVSAYSGSVKRMGKLGPVRRGRPREDRPLLIDDGRAPEPEHDEADQDDERPSDRVRAGDRREEP